MRFAWKSAREVPIMQNGGQGILTTDTRPPAPTMLPKRLVPAEIKRNLKSWEHMAVGLRIAFVFLGCTGTVSGLLATATSGDPKLTYWTKIFTVSAAASIGLLTAFDIGGKANAVRKAWRNLNAAILLYEEDAEFTAKELIAEFRRGEEIIGDVNYIPQKVEPRNRTNKNGSTEVRGLGERKAVSKPGANGASIQGEQQSRSLIESA